MKLIKFFNLVILASIMAVIFTGCQIGPQRPKVIPGERPAPKDESLNQQPVPLPLPPQQPVNENPNNFTPPNTPGKFDGWSEDTAALKAQTVYFDFDKSAIKKSQQSKMDEVAAYLKSNPAKAVRVEGNCDERGTEEYNRSLGERRALAAREYLINSGIDAQRVDTVTRGEDNPAVKGHSEAAWSKNRRDEFIVLTPPGK